jgi:hypothetical protein
VTDQGNHAAELGHAASPANSRSTSASAARLRASRRSPVAFVSGGTLRVVSGARGRTGWGIAGLSFGYAILALFVLLFVAYASRLGG